MSLLEGYQIFIHFTNITPIHIWFVWALALASVLV
jgi:hypothetical protein